MRWDSRTHLPSVKELLRTQTTVIPEIGAGQVKLSKWSWKLQKNEIPKGIGIIIQSKLAVCNKFPCRLVKSNGKLNYDWITKTHM